MSNLTIQADKPKRTGSQKVGVALGYGCIGFGAVIVFSSAVLLIGAIWRAILS
jgi:hypothetical protein